MLSPTAYYPIYLALVSFFTIFCIVKYSYYPNERVFLSNKSGPYIPSLLLTILLILFVGLRPLSYAFVDMMNYSDVYSDISKNSSSFEINYDSENFIFDNIFQYFATNLFEITVLFSLMALIYFGSLFFAIKKIFPNDVLYALIIYLGAFFTFSYATNGIKAGVAATLFLLSFAYYRKLILVILFFILSFGFHHSMMLPIVAFALAFVIRNPKWFFFGWILCLILSFFHITSITEFLASFADEKGQGYLLGDEVGWGGKTGFRWDFVLYSLIPIFIGIWAIYRHRVIDRLYQLLLCTYLAVNGIWMLCMYVPFNNRIAYLSWFMLPVVSIYPFLKLKTGTRQYIQLNYIASFFLAFTLLIYFLL